MNGLEQWERTIADVLARRRHRLTGSEYVAVVDAIDRACDAKELRQIAVRLASRLGEHDGPSGSASFTSSALNRAYRDGARGKGQGPTTGDAPAATSAPRLGSLPQHKHEVRHGDEVDKRDLERPRPA